MEDVPQPVVTAGRRSWSKWLPRFRDTQVWYYFGPAFVASVAYIDPGNFATNIQGGTEFGYSLLWVLLWSNAMAILIQYLSAKLGIATGRTLPQNCRDQFSPRVNFGLWIAAELSALATDLAEFLGAALGFYLLFNLPMLASALLTGVLVFLILATELYGFRKLEQIIMLFVAAIATCYGVEIFLSRPEWGPVFYHVFVPHIRSSSVYIAVGMLGATVMPHVVYLHSALVQGRAKEHENHPEPWLKKLHHARYELIDVFVAMNGAWLVNSAMIIMAAAVFFHAGRPVMTIEQAHETLRPLLGPLSATVFAFALLCSGLSSSTVGTMAGQVIIEGFLNIRFNIFWRRLLTMIPAIIVIASGLDPLKVLVLSQVVLSFTLPFALIPLITLTRRKDVMGDLVNHRHTNVLAFITVGVILALNALLLYQTFGGTF
ncbi:MAG TPA: Nramp family divalent metal transporter [Terriglobales bacterium]|nr:Nramp family divalent metal transporter [Terriglobales bacterium]